ncbi:MAG: hypothetical protein AAB439_03915 [Patescibacteria group bacterium]|mgnify:CR=1 FL=1
MKTKTVTFERGTLFVSIVSFLVIATFALATVVAQAASTDYFLKLDGVEGESTKSTTEPTTTDIQVSPYRPAPVEESKPTPGVEPDEIDVADDGEELTPDTAVLLGGGSDDAEEKKGNVEYGWKVEEGEKISVSAVEVRGWDATTKEAFLLDVKAFAELQSGQDLENFAKGVLLEDENIEDIEFRTNGLEVAYRATGKLLGFIPHTFTERVVVEGEDGQDIEVKVKLPWYSFLLSPDVDPNDIAEEAKKKHKETIEIASWSFGASNSGTLLVLLSDILQTKHDTAKNSIGNVR